LVAERGVKLRECGFDPIPIDGMDRMGVWILLHLKVVEHCFNTVGSSDKHRHRLEKLAGGRTGGNTVGQIPDRIRTMVQQQVSVFSL